MSRLSFRNVSVYEARDNFWKGEILKYISGDSLYMKDPAKHEWGFEIECDETDGPHSVHFSNSNVWGFCAMSDFMRNIMWPRFLQDYRTWAASGQGKITARVSRIFSDSFHIELVSMNAYMHDILVWHYPPKQRECPEN